ncbi:MAG: DUF1801 domain-containing protein [Ignavibacteriae bacterium]|nr:MAG: DUF1801 domain-containing protein [Ignavibacteriota bacterium]
MAENKTKPTDASVAELLSTQDAQRKADCKEIIAMMQVATGSKPKIWGPDMIGFGEYHYVYESGREGDWFLCGFSPRKTAISLYIMSGFNQYEALMSKLGKFKTGKSCLYVKKLDDIDRNVLQKLINSSVTHMKKVHGA